MTGAFVDKGDLGHACKGEVTILLAGSSSRKLTLAMKRRRKHRSALEPKTGHLKSNQRIQRGILRGLTGDAINATLVAAGLKLIQLLRVEPLADFPGSDMRKKNNSVWQNSLRPVTVPLI